jgi:hypothetical protein
MVCPLKHKNQPTDPLKCRSNKSKWASVAYIKHVSKGKIKLLLGSIIREDVRGTGGTA